MTRTAATVATMGAVALLALTAPGTAGSEPNDVTVATSVAGNTVTLTVHNRSAAAIACEVGGFREGDAPVPEKVVFGDVIDVGPATPLDRPYFDVPDGNYLIHWVCQQRRADDTIETWGTITEPLTAAPNFVVVPSNPQPVAPSPCIAGSSCRPPSGSGAGSS